MKIVLFGCTLLFLATAMPVTTATSHTTPFLRTQQQPSSQQYLRRRLDQQDQQGDDQAAAAAAANDDQYATSYLLVSQCAAFTTEPAQDDNGNGNDELDGFLEWAQLDDLVRVSQASYIFYTYNAQGQASQAYVADLPSFVETYQNDGSSLCVELENPQDVITNDGTLDAYLNADSWNEYQSAVYGNGNYNNNNNNNNNGRHLEDGQQQYGQPKLYVGVMCDLLTRTHSSAMNVGIFLDDQCTTWVPRWTYEYRNLIQRGKTESTLSTTLKTLSSRITSSVACDDIGVCGSILEVSADTDTCTAYYQQEEEQNNGDDDGNQRRGLEDQEQQQQESDGYYYQLSRDDLDDIAAACVTTQTSLQNGQDLRSYLAETKSLPQERGLSRGGKIALWFLGIFALVDIIFFGWYCSHKKSSSDDDDDDDSVPKKNGRVRRTRSRTSRGARTEPLVTSSSSDAKSTRRSSSPGRNAEPKRKRRGLGKFFSSFRRKASV